MNASENHQGVKAAIRLIHECIRTTIETAGGATTQHRAQERERRLEMLGRTSAQQLSTARRIRRHLRRCRGIKGLRRVNVPGDGGRSKPLCVVSDVEEMVIARVIEKMIRQVVAPQLGLIRFRRQFD